MGFLHKLWDDTLAGPAPEAGLGKLRKYDSFSASRSSPIAVCDRDKIMITRSITILKRNNMNGGFRNLDPGSGSVPESPLGSSNPDSPITPGTPRGDFKRLFRTKSSPEAESKRIY